LKTCLGKHQQKENISKDKRIEQENGRSYFTLKEYLS